MTESLKTFVKDPNETLDYLVDWTEYLGSDDIATSTWSTSQENVDVVSSTNTAKTTTGWVSGGADGDKVYVSNRIVTVGGRTVERSFTLRIKDR